MSAMTQNVQNDQNKDLRQLEREADSARTELEHTLEALEQRLSPGALVEQAMRAVRDNGGEFGSNLAAQVRSNPLPTVLASAGLMWLMASSKTAPRRGFDENGEPSPRHRATSAVDSVKHAAQRATDSARDAAAGVRGLARDVSGAGSSVAASTRVGAHELQEGWLYMNREHPLVLGALAVAAGAALATWLPTTENEDDWMGEASDDAKSRVGDEVTKLAGQAREAADDAADDFRQGADITRDSIRAEGRPETRP